jgi:S-(hydroxymethyl)glutathione dehydrogenase/alcohol dehydrogenase
MIIGVDLNPAREALARKFGMTHFVNPKEVGGRPRRAPRRAHRRRRRLQLRVHRQRHVMRQALECCHKRLGRRRSSSASPAPAQEIKTRPFQLVTGRVWKGTAFGGARGRTDVPKIVDWYMDGKINIDDADHAHVMPLERDQRGFDLMHAASRSGSKACRPSRPSPRPHSAHGAKKPSPATWGQIAAPGWHTMPPR